MIYKKWRGYLLAAETDDLFPSEAVSTEETKNDTNTLYLVNRDPKTSRGVYAVESYEEIFSEAVVGNLCIPAPGQRDCIAEKTCSAEGVSGDPETGAKEKSLYRVVNVAFPKALEYVCRYDAAVKEKKKLTVTLVGLGDVGGTVLMGLKLLGTELEKIQIFDPNEAAGKRYETELNQVLPVHDGEALPKVTICKEEDLFHCDVFLFTASRGVPGLDTKVTDVRMAQFEANRKMLDWYAKKARDLGYEGLFCQISDPVDHLAREVFLASNRDDEGNYDYMGLLPEQVQGFGLGVMSARAAYYAKEDETPIVYGPHGKGLIVANAPGDAYDDERSMELTKLTTEANLRVRELGYKPYIAPGLSSAAISILRMLRGEYHNGAVPMDGAYFGCRSKFTRDGIVYKKEEICDRLLIRMQESHRALKEFQYEH